MNQPPQGQKITRNLFKYFSVLFLVSLILFIASVVTHRGSDVWGIVLTVVIASFLGVAITWTVLHRPPDAARHSRPYDWIFSFILAALFFNNARLAWFNHSLDTDSSFWPYWLGLVVVIVLVGRIATKSWTRMFWYDRELKPRDEREQQVLRRSTESTFYAAMIIIFLLADLFLMAPVPSKSALFDLMIAVGTLLVGLRNFFSWKYGY